MLVSPKWWRIFRGGVQVRGSATYFSRPTPLYDSRINSRQSPLTAKGMGANDVPSAPFTRSGVCERLGHELVNVVVVAVIDAVDIL
jgi:hypothetical protein